MKHVGILATTAEGAALCSRSSVSRAPYPRALAARGIAAKLPAADERTVLHEIILGELIKGVFTDRARQAYARVIEGMAARGCDAVGLVCTEIPLLVPPDAAALPVLDSPRLLARAGFEVATGRRPLPSWRGGPL